MTTPIKIDAQDIRFATELGYKIKPTDKVQYDGETIKGQTKRYVLLFIDVLIISIILLTGTGEINVFF